MIQFQNVSKQYQNNDFVLGELNFTINPGEFLFLIGPSGSGKTTVIKLLTREESPTAGKIFFDDFDITKLSQNNIYKLRRQIGVIFQDYKLIPDKTVWENVAFAMEVAGKSSKEIKETVPYLLDIVGLSHRGTAFPAFLSGGEKQRVAIARAVSNNPKILIADEPTGNLDPAAAWDIVQILSKINNWGTTVIMSTHGSDIVNTLGKRVIQMHNGVVVRDDNKGGYEIASSIPSVAKEVSAPESNTTENSGPIKVRLKPGGRPSIQKAVSKGWRWFGWFKGKPVEPEALPEVVSEVTEQIVEVKKKNLGKIVRKANLTPVSKLKIPTQVVNDLQSAGYKDIEDVISGGIQGLSNKPTIDQTEVVQVAQAVEEFIANEEVQMQAEVKVKPKKTSPLQKSASMARTKAAEPTPAEVQTPKSSVTQVEPPAAKPASKVKITLTANSKKAK